MRILIALLSAFLLISFNNVVFAENFYLDSNRNKGTLRFELDKTKNKYSRRTIKLIPVMMSALKDQKKIYEKFNGENFSVQHPGNASTEAT